jgi:hypothetical protein
MRIRNLSFNDDGQVPVCSKFCLNGRIPAIRIINEMVQSHENPFTAFLANQVKAMS